MRVLSMPPAAQDDPEALEMIRGWIIGGQLHISLAAWVWKDEPETWGRLLAEAAGHLADAIAKDTGANRSATLARIQESLVSHLENLPSTLTGDFVSRPQ
jgi:hypothetical protein